MEEEMKNIEDMFTVEEIQTFIDKVLCRNDSEIEDKARASLADQTARANDPRLDACCRALERIEILKGEILSGAREKSGEIIVRV